MSCSPPRAARAARATRASPCRWEAHTTARRRWRLGRSAAAAVSACREVVDHPDASRLDPGVLQAQRQLGGARAGACRTAYAPGEQLEVGVPDPGDVVPVGDVVVEHAEQIVLAWLQGERAQHLVGARRVLDEQDLRLASIDGDGLRSSKRRSGALQPRDDVGQRDLQRDCERSCGEGVVDVVQTGQRQPRPPPRPPECSAESEQRARLRASPRWRARWGRVAAARSSDSGSGRGDRDTRRRTHRARRSDGSAWHRRHAPCRPTRATRRPRRSTRPRLAHGRGRRQAGRRRSARAWSCEPVRRAARRPSCSAIASSSP